MKQISGTRCGNRKSERAQWKLKITQMLGMCCERCGGMGKIDKSKRICMWTLRDAGKTDSIGASSELSDLSFSPEPSNDGT